jgi:RNA polymerase sigma factor (TIGR02999 family)
MRQLLVEAARRRKAQKRGGDETVAFVTFSDPSEPIASCAEDLLILDAALSELAELSPRQAAIVENRYFGGLDVSETAELLDISVETVARDWRLAKAWLSHQLRRPR